MCRVVHSIGAPAGQDGAAIPVQRSSLLQTWNSHGGDVLRNYDRRLIFTVICARAETLYFSKHCNDLSEPPPAALQTRSNRDPPGAQRPPSAHQTCPWERSRTTLHYLICPNGPRDASHNTPSKGVWIQKKGSQNPGESPISGKVCAACITAPDQGNRVTSRRGRVLNRPYGFVDAGF
jgi:hypothetical protein